MEMYILQGNDILSTVCINNDEVFSTKLFFNLTPKYNGKIIKKEQFHKQVLPTHDQSG